MFWGTVHRMILMELLKIFFLAMVGLTGILSYLSSTLAHREDHKHAERLVQLKAELDTELAGRRSRVDAEIAQRRKHSTPSSRHEGTPSTKSWLAATVQ